MGGGGNYGEILAEEGERQSVTHPPLEVWDTCVPVPAPVSGELFIQPRKEKLRFYFILFFCIFLFQWGKSYLKSILYDFRKKKYSHRRSWKLCTRHTVV